MKPVKNPLVLKSPNVDRRLQVFLFLCLVSFAVLIFRLWTIQIYQKEKYEAQSERNFERKVLVQSKRGIISDRNGRTLAEDKNNWDVWIPIKQQKGKRIVTPEIKTSLEILSQILGIHYDILERRYLNSSRDPYYKQDRICVEKRIPYDKYVAILSRNIEIPKDASLFPEKVLTRYYRYGDTACHLLGQTGEIDAQELEKEQYKGYNPGDYNGKTGIEYQCESYLRGVNGVNMIYVDKYEIQRGQIQEVTPAVPGNNVVLSIDMELQQAAERILGASYGVIIAADPRDNSILAMACSPRYEPNRLSPAIFTDPGRPLFNRAVSGLYSPGSVIKIFETFALMEEMKIPAQYSEFCPGEFSLPGSSKVWKCHQKGGHGKVNLIEAIRYSCDVFFYKTVGAKLGIDRLVPWMEHFGLDAKTGIDIPGESYYPFPSRNTIKDWSPGFTVNIAIGQGQILFTPIQISTGVCAIANGGTLYKPRLAQRIVAPDGQVLKTFEPAVNGKVHASTATWNTIHQAMWEVVNHPGGTGRRVKNDRFILAGKTGTVEVGVPGREPHAWFVCYGPYENPQIAITVLVENSGHGGEVASPLAKQLLEVYLKRGQSQDLVRL